MIKETNQTSLGFDNLFLQGWQQQIRQGAARLASGELTPAEQRQVEKLKQTDQRVKAHEQAHLRVGRELVRGGADFSYETGPDKKRYAVAGEVEIDTSKAKTPEETIPKAQHIRATALAPADPSPQDRQVASLASQMEMQARQEVAIQAAEERRRAASEGNGKAIGAYQAAGGLESTLGFSTSA